ncbi:MAG: Pycsar system effector family protein [Ginsengibacter sp.]
MKLSNELLRETAKYVEQYMHENFTDDIVFHSYRHTAKVVRACDLLSMESDLSKHDRHLVHLAAWFSNIGYNEGADKHEGYSAKHAKHFFETKALDKDDIQEIQDCIMATQSPQHPHSATARILCDAVLYHLSDNNYFDELKLLRTEWELRKVIKYNDEEWFQLNINFLSNHFYFTPFARKNFNKEKKSNLARLKGHLAIIKHSEGTSNQLIGEFDEGKNLFDTGTKLERGVETLFRTAANNHMQLSQMGDGKANILISINSIILSVMISFVLTRLDVNKHLMIPTLMIIIVCVTTIVLAVLSTRPKISHGIFTAQQIISKEANLLFFGNFHNMPLAEYKSAVKEMMLDKEFLYESLIMDIYYVGKVLARKYRFTTWAYNVFMFGLVICMIAFTISFWIYNNRT